MALELTILSITLDRRHKLKIPGTLVADSKRVYDHRSRTESIPTRRQTFIDLLVARDSSEDDTRTIEDQPNKPLITDSLMKRVVSNEAYKKLIEQSIYSLAPSVKAGCKRRP